MNLKLWFIKVKTVLVIRILKIDENKNRIKLFSPFK